MQVCFLATHTCSFAFALKSDRFSIGANTFGLSLHASLYNVDAFPTLSLI